MMSIKSSFTEWFLKVVLTLREHSCSRSVPPQKLTGRGALIQGLHEYQEIIPDKRIERDWSGKSQAENPGMCMIFRPKCRIFITEIVTIRLIKKIEPVLWEQSRQRQAGSGFDILSSWVRLSFSSLGIWGEKKMHIFPLRSTTCGEARNFDHPIDVDS